MLVSRCSRHASRNWVGSSNAARHFSKDLASHEQRKSSMLEIKQKLDGKRYNFELQPFGLHPTFAGPAAVGKWTASTEAHGLSPGCYSWGVWWPNLDYGMYRIHNSDHSLRGYRVDALTMVKWSAHEVHFLDLLLDAYITPSTLSSSSLTLSPSFASYASSPPSSFSPPSASFASSSSPSLSLSVPQVADNEHLVVEGWQVTLEDQSEVTEAAQRNLLSAAQRESIEDVRLLVLTNPSLMVYLADEAISSAMAP